MRHLKEEEKDAEEGDDDGFNGLVGQLSVFVADLKENFGCLILKVQFYVTLQFCTNSCHTIVLFVKLSLNHF